MKRRWSLRKKLAGLALMMLALFFASCGEKEKKDLPEDTPWNHGFNSIMETDIGYYSNLLDEQHLCYYDKESGNSILLCNKPECTHEGGNDCEATYQKMQTMNTILYDGYLYILGVEDVDHMVSISFYRGALDGSSMDKIGTVISRENTKDQEFMIFNPRSEDSSSFQNDCCSFIIHKGYAYIPYYLRFGQGMKGFMGGGLIKMDIRTGEMKELYTTEHANADTPMHLVGAGDYVYFDLGLLHKQRYVISEDRIEDCTWGKKAEQGGADSMRSKPEAGNEQGANEEPSEEKIVAKEYFTLQEALDKAGVQADGSIMAVSYIGAGHYFYTEDKVYSFFGDKLYVYDARTMESTGEIITLESLPSFESNATPMGIVDQKVQMYEDTFMIASTEKAYFYDLQGKLMGELAIPENVRTHKQAFHINILDYKFHDGKVYLINRFVWPSHQWFRVFSCELEDIRQGTGAWKETFVIRGIDGRGDEESTSDLF